MVVSQIPLKWLLRSAVIVAAHPDDEVIGVGSLLTQFRALRAIVHVTDGAPRTRPNWKDYAALRRNELHSALTKARIPFVSTICFGYPDQQAVFHIDAIANRLVKVFQKFRPVFVFTHPYEGGHPDHDAVAAAVHLATTGKARPATLEFSSYHAGPMGMQTECFLELRKRCMILRALNGREAAIKRDLLACFESQRDVLAHFPVHDEPLRMAPRYEFSRPPHKGQLLYESFGWGISGLQWRRHARKAFRWSF